jgi:hypothetical protein
MKRIHLHSTPEQLTEEILAFTSSNLKVNEIVQKDTQSASNFSLSFLKIAAIFILFMGTFIALENGNAYFSNEISVNYFPVLDNLEQEVVPAKEVKEPVQRQFVVGKEYIQDKIEISEVIDADEIIHVVATETITLKPGFQVLPGATFQASITSSSL